MASLAAVDSNGVRQQVIDVVEDCLERHVHLTDDRERFWLTFNTAFSQRDAEYIVECLRILLKDHEHIADRLILSLDNDEISDEAVHVFGGFLRETLCHLVGLILYQLPSQQFRRLLEALHTNTSIKELCICDLRDKEGASWIADLLRHKRDFTYLQLQDCRFPFAQILPLLRGQSNLTALVFVDCHISNSNDCLLFYDPEFTQLFVDNILLSQFTTLKTLCLCACGVSLENRPLMAGFHKNTTVVELNSQHDAATHLFIDPIMRRNIHLGHVHGMLGTTTLAVPPAGVGEIVIVPTIPPPCGLWATVMAKVGQGSQGSTPVFTILRDRLATWMIPPNGATGTEAQQPRLHKKRAASTTTHKNMVTSKKPKSDML